MEQLREWRGRIGAELDAAVAFWERHSHDPEHGGFFSCLSRDGSVYDDTKFVWLQGRQVRVGRGAGPGGHPAPPRAPLSPPEPPDLGLFPPVPNRAPVPPARAARGGAESRGVPAEPRAAPPRLLPRRLRADPGRAPGAAPAQLLQRSVLRAGAGRAGPGGGGPPVPGLGSGLGFGRVGLGPGGSHGIGAPPVRGDPPPAGAGPAPDGAQGGAAALGGPQKGPPK